MTTRSNQNRVRIYSFVKPPSVHSLTPLHWPHKRTAKPRIPPAQALWMTVNNQLFSLILSRFKPCEGFASSAMPSRSRLPVFTSLPPLPFSRPATRPHHHVIPALSAGDQNRPSAKVNHRGKIQVIRQGRAALRRAITVDHHGQIAHK